MKKIIIICLAFMAVAAGCKRVEVDFTYSPAEPKAGETITFTNNSSAGESWTWTFGDNATSLVKSPSKVYKKPGEYLVTLMVDSAKHQTCSKVVTVYDTIPTFVCSSDSILHYQDVTLQANIYNPFNQTLTYTWQLPDNCVLQSGTINSSSIVVYFTSAGTASVQLTIMQNTKSFDIEKTLTIHTTKAPAIVMRRTDMTVVRQRIINDRIEQVSAATSEDVYSIEQTQDTMLIFNNQAFYASQMTTLVAGFENMDIQHLQIDGMQMKWYVTTKSGLYVANFDGSNIVLIDDTATGAIYLDAQRNRIYWANKNGLCAMPLVKSKNNQFNTNPTYYNNLTDIDLITVNNKLQ